MSVEVNKEKHKTSVRFEEECGYILHFCFFLNNNSDLLLQKYILIYNIKVIYWYENTARAFKIFMIILQKYFEGPVLSR